MSTINPEKIPNSKFPIATLQVSKKAAQDAWVDAMAGFCSVENISNIKLRKQWGSNNYCEGSIDAFLFPGILTLNVQASSQRFKRSHVDIARTCSDSVVLEYIHKGQVLYQNHGEELHYQAGEIRLVDMSRPSFADTSCISSYSIVIPRKSFDALGLDLENLHLNKLSRDNPFARILRRHVYDLHNLATRMSVQEALSLVEPTLSLIRACFIGTTSESKKARSLAERNHLIELRRLIDINLFNSNLNPDALAKSLSISRSKLYRLAEPLGGIQTFIRNRRLRYAFQQLATEESQNLTVTSLADSLGFKSESSFRRGFKLIFGMSPSEVRQQGVLAYNEYHCTRKIKPSNGGNKVIGSGDMLYKEWINNLFC